MRRGPNRSSALGKGKGESQEDSVEQSWAGVLLHSEEELDGGVQLQGTVFSAGKRMGDMGAKQQDKEGSNQDKVEKGRTR